MIGWQLDATSEPIDGTDGLDLVQLMQIVIRRWWVLVLAAMICGPLGIVAATLLKPANVARMVMIPLPAKENALQAVQGQRAGISGITSAISIGGSRTPTEISTYYSTLESMGVTTALIKQGLLTLLSPPGEKSVVPVDDPAGRSSVKGMGDWLSTTIKQSLGLPAKLPPNDPAFVWARLSKIVTLTTLDKELASSVYTLSVKLNDPERALKVLALVHREVINQIRQRELMQSHELVDVLRKIYNQTDSLEYRRTLSLLLADEEQKYMLLQDDAYPVAVEVIDPPAITGPSQVSLSFWFVVGAGVGVVIASAFILISVLRSTLPEPSRH